MPLVFPPMPPLAAVALSYFLTAALAIQAFGTLTPIWYCNAIVLVALLRHPPRTWWAFLLAAGAADALAVHLYGQGPPVLVAGTDMLEVVLAAAIVLRTGGLREPLLTRWQMGRVMLASALAPLASATVGAAVMARYEHEPFGESWHTWYSASALGLVIVTPFLLSWTHAQQRREMVRELTWQRVAIIAVGSAAAAATVSQHMHPALLFFTFPIVLWLTWAWRLLGATAAMVAVMLAALHAAMAGPHDVFTQLMPDAPLPMRIEALQLYLAAMLISAVPLAVVRSRTQDLLQELRRVGNARADFLAAMSHEIRTPMTGVLGMADLLAQEPLTGRQRRYLEAMRGSGRHLLSVINDILDFSRIESGKLELDSTDFELTEVIEGTRSLMHPLAVERGLELRIEFEDTFAQPLRGDPLRLRQVLLNLVGNAIKFTEHGSVTLRVARRAAAEPHGLLLLCEVIDTGVGIEPERLERLFSPFMQADASTSREYGGSGLGLAISKRLVEAMGGTIGARSRPGRGSAFHFEVPLALGEVRPGTATSEPALDDVRPQRILVAEDVDINRELLEAALTHSGHEVVFAGNGQQAVEIAGARDFDLILMDVQMPVLDGVAATQRIRQLPGARGATPIVGLTANVMARERERYLAAGMDDCLTKPIQWEQLAAAVAHHGRGQQIAPPGAPDAAAGEPLIDERALLALRGLVDGVDLHQLLERGLEGYEAGCRRLLDPATDADEARRAAHGIKGSSATLGLARVSALAARIEGDEERPAPATVLELALQLHGALAQTRRELAGRGLLPPAA